MGLIEYVTHKKISTALTPRTELLDEIVLTHSPKNFVRSFVIRQKQIKVTETRGLVTKLPTKSNITDIDKELDKIKKEWHGYKATTHSKDKDQIVWIDKSNRFIANKVESRDGISYVLRGDVVNLLFNRDKILVQCDSAYCDVLIPQSIQVDLNKYNVKKTEASGKP